MLARFSGTDAGWMRRRASLRSELVWLAYPVTGFSVVQRRFLRIRHHLTAYGYTDSKKASVGFASCSTFLKMRLKKSNICHKTIGTRYIQFNKLNSKVSQDHVTHQATPATSVLSNERRQPAEDYSKLQLNPLSGAHHYPIF